MFDAALPAGSRSLEEPRRGLLWPAALAGALLLHLGGFGLALWLAAPTRLPQTTEPMVIELSLEPLAPEAPAEAMSEPMVEPPPPEAEAPPPEPAPAEPAPLPEPPPIEPLPIQPVAPPPEPPRPAAPRPRAQTPQPPRERRTPPGPAAAAPAAPSAAAAPPVAPPAGPPVFTNARFRRPPTPPDYPMVARERGITGTALVRALVGADGETKEVRLHRSSGNEALDAAALAAVRRWAFAPSAREGQPMESWIEVPIRFQLR